ncbi:MAG: methyltransferase domain-containing protein [Actinobacteria bacterium]|nr:methyltransferase domain-containing protein [Actinomycetota bacterium]
MRAPTKENLRHLSLFLRLGSNPAAAVYDSIGPDFFLAPAPGWLNLGLWEGDGRSEDPLEAVKRLVSRLASKLPTDEVILDVGNGLGAQDPVIASVARPQALIALNITESQLRAGRARLREAGAAPVNADATRLPVANGSIDGVISVEAAFHFPSRKKFFTEVYRALRPGGILTMSDVSAERFPTRPGEAVAGFVNLRVWGLKSRNMMSADAIRSLLRQTGFADIHVERCGEKVIDPAVVYLKAKWRTGGEAPFAYRAGSRMLLNQWELLRRRELLEYLLISASKPL